MEKRTAALESVDRLRINVWYGTSQQFGIPGIAQKWINILGNVAPTNQLASLSYSLNGTPVKTLSIGPDNRRLLKVGDFNIEIDKAALKKGQNLVQIVALDYLGQKNIQQVKIHYQPNIWPLPYQSVLQETTNLQELVQLVDGHWFLEKRRICTNPDAVGYDRSFAIGDATWVNYSITFSVIINKIDAKAYQSAISQSPGFGIILRWLGHSHFPISGRQPKSGWEPFGGLFWYQFQKKKKGKLSFLAPPPTVQTIEENAWNLKLGKQYWIKTSVESTPAGHLYRFCMWQDNQLEKEGVEFYHLIDTDNLSSGSMLFFAHHVDLTIGNISVTPLKAEEKMRSRVYAFYDWMIHLPLIGVLAYGCYRFSQIENIPSHSQVGFLLAIFSTFLYTSLMLLTKRKLAIFLFKQGIKAKQAMLIIQIKNMLLALLLALTWLLVIFSVSSILN
ncbi:MAG: hypothetical protein AAF960_19325 [Bacteroidota bacterium]